MKLLYKPQVVKQLRRLNQKEQKKVLKKLALLASDPFCGKPLKGELEGLRSLRTWPYRIIYKLQSKRIIIFSVAHRQAVYK